METIVSRKNLKEYQIKISKIINEDLDLKTADLWPVLQPFIKQNKKIIALTKKYDTPFYLYDKNALNRSISEYVFAFKKYLPQAQHYYAVKVNHHPWVIKEIVRKKFGLDVSSGRELKIALKAGAKKIVFTGPGKTTPELKLALNNHTRVIINIDSFGELKRLESLLKIKPVPIKLGVRIFTKSQGDWNKFGIPVSDLKTFWQKAKKLPGGKIEGIHFHSSWNQDASPYQAIIKELSAYLKNNFSQKQLSEIKFIDFGGGFRPYQNEGFLPSETTAGEIIKSASDYAGSNPKFSKPYFLTEAITINEYAKGIAKAIDQYLKPILNCYYITEPGRIICNEALHLVLKIIDVKKPGQAIADGGINLIGWERYEHDYFPTINLTHPSREEIKYNIMGSLCLPQDKWSSFCYAKKVVENDIILIPNQGALTYSLAQDFIKPIAKTYRLN